VAATSHAAIATTATSPASQLCQSMRGRHLLERVAVSRLRREHRQGL
jgi:hypothetical protein